MNHDWVVGPKPSVLTFGRDNDQKVVVFDSPDGTGKSNIAYGLSERIKIPYFKVNSEHQHWREGKFKTALEFDQTYLVQLLEQTRLSVVIDRAYPAEWVYSRVFGRETNDKLLEELDQRFSRLGANIIIPVREDYSKNRKDELVENRMLPKLHEGYLRFRDWTKCRTVLIYVDSYGENLQAELDAIVPELNFGRNSLIQADVTLHRTVKGKFSDEEIKRIQKEQMQKALSSMDHLSSRRIKGAK